MYNQAPLESIIDEKDEIRWNSIVDKYTSVNYKTLKEKEDTTEVQDTVACGGGACEVPNLQEVKVSEPEVVVA